MTPEMAELQASLPAAAVTGAVDHTPALVRQTELEVALIRAACSLREMRPKLLKSGSLSRKSIERVQEELGSSAPAVGGDALQVAEFVLGLLRESGLAVERDARLEPDQPAMDAFFQLSPAERLQALREAWLASLLNDFAWTSGSNPGDGLRLGSGVDRNGYSLGRKELRQAREAVLSNLGHGGWVLLKRLQEHVTAIPPQHMPPIAGLAAGPGAKPANWPTEPEALTGFCEGLCRIPLVMLGWIATASDGEGGLMYRVRELAGELAVDGVTAQPMMVQPTFDVVVLMPEIDAPRLWRLARIAAPTNSQQVAHFKIEEKHVAQAANDGTTVDAMLAFLREASKTPVPQNVDYSMREWVRRTERITIWLDAILFEAEGVEDVQKLVNAPGTPIPGVIPVAGKHMAASDVSATAALTALAARYPVFDYTRTLPAAIDAGPDGELRCDSERLHFRSAQLLGRVTDVTGLDRWKLTQSSVKRCVTSGWTYERLVDGLAEHVRGKLPPMLRARLLAWAGRGGEAWLGRPLLLGLTNPDMARLVREGGGFDGLLEGALNTQAFAIAEESIEQIEQELAALSISVRRDDAAQPPEGVLAQNTGQLARVFRAPERPSPVDGAKLLALWRRDSMAAAEIVVRARAAMSFAVRVPGEAADRMTLVPLSLVVLPERVWLEAEVVRQRMVKLFDLSWVSEPEALPPGGGV